MAEKFTLEKYRELAMSRNCLFYTVRGSHVFGTASETSDEDTDGVYYEPTVLFNPSKHIPCLETETNDNKLVSLDQFVDYLEEGDCNTVEMIHIPEKFWKKVPDPIFRWIFQNCNLFITRNFFVKAAEFARNQVRKEIVKANPEKRNKLASHAIRIINMCIQCIAESNAARVPVPLKLDRTGIDADEILRLKYQTAENQMSADEMMAIIEPKLKEFESLVKDKEIMRVFGNTIRNDVREHLLNIMVFEKAKLSLGFNSAVNDRMSSPIPVKTPDWFGIEVTIKNFLPGKNLHFTPLGTCPGYEKPTKSQDNLEVWLETDGIQAGENYVYHFPPTSTRTFINRMKDEYQVSNLIPGERYEIDLESEGDRFSDPKKFLRKSYTPKE